MVTHNNQLHIKALTGMRGERVLFKALSVHVEQGKILFIEGANGSGKTTLLRTICGLTKPVFGSVQWNNQNIDDLNEEYFAQLLYLGHLTGIKDDLTPVENLQFAMTLHGLAITKNEAITALDTFSIKCCAHLPTRVLSQGQKRRVALAQLCLHDNPSQKPLWVLDEPFTALDIAAIKQLSLHIEQYVDKGGMVIFTSHQPPTFNASMVQRLALQ